MNADHAARAAAQIVNLFDPLKPKHELYGLVLRLVLDALNDAEADRHGVTILPSEN